MKLASVEILVGKEQVMQALRSMTIHDENFDPGPWSIWDAEVMEMAARLIRREIAGADRARGKVSVA